MPRPLFEDRGKWEIFVYVQFTHHFGPGLCESSANDCDSPTEEDLFQGSDRNEKIARAAFVADSKLYFGDLSRKLYLAIRYSAHVTVIYLLPATRFRVVIGSALFSVALQQID